MVTYLIRMFPNNQRGADWGKRKAEKMVFINHIRDIINLIAF